LQQQQQRPKRGNIVVEKKGACFKRIGMTMVRIERRRRRSIGHILPKLQDRHILIRILGRTRMYRHSKKPLSR
jgi:hypothetical protein